MTAGGLRSCQQSVCVRPRSVVQGLDRMERKTADATEVAPAARCLTLDYGFLVLSAAAESAFGAMLSVAGAAAGATAGAALSATGASLVEELHAARTNTAAARARRFIFNVLQGNE